MGFLKDYSTGAPYVASGGKIRLIFTCFNANIAFALPGGVLGGSGGAEPPREKRKTEVLVQPAVVREKPSQGHGPRDAIKKPSP